MSLLTAAEQRRRSAVRRVAAGVGALVAVVTVSVAVTMLVVGDNQPQPPTSPPRVGPSPSRPTSEYADAGTWQLKPVSAGPLILPRPDGNEQGIPTGFAHSTEGAISAAAHYAETSVTLDPEVARSLGQVAGAPSYSDAGEDFVQAARSARERLGVADSPRVNGAYLIFQAQAYRVSDAMPSRVDVAILGRVDGAGPATQGQGRSGPTSTSYTMVWAEGDWHLAGDGEPLSGSAPAPRSANAYDEGWRDLAMG